MKWNQIWPPKPARSVFLVCLTLFCIGFLAGDYAFFHFIFRNLLGSEDIPRLLLVAVATKLMGLVLLTTFTLMIFSAAVSALSYLYLDEDLHLLLPLPFHQIGLRSARAFQAAMSAGYAVGFILLPVVFSFVLLRPWAWKAALAGTLGLFFYLVTPLSWGVGITTLLARFFPAKRLHQMLTVLTVVLLCLLVVLFRISKPEMLLNPESSTQVVKVLKSIELPTERVLPSTWLAELVVQGTEGNWERALPGLWKLTALAGGSLFTVMFLMRIFYWRGYARSQEQAGMSPGSNRGRVGRAVLAFCLIFAPGSARTRALLRRDTLSFFRDPVQWGQLFILGALVIIYLFNVRFMPTGTDTLRVAVVFWNLATLELIVAAVAGRFSLTAVGGEGNAYFSSRTLPISVWEYLWAKFLFTCTPITVMSVGILYGSAFFLGIRGTILWYTIFLGVSSSVALSVLALTMGCMRPIFDSKNLSKAVMSAWGLGFMFLSLVYVGWVLIVSARPIYDHFTRILGGGAEPDFLRASLHVGLVSLALILGTFWMAARRLKSLSPG